MPFPTNQFTVRDQLQPTRLRIALPLPNCSNRPSDCEDIRVLNTLDGFSLQPRLSIPFDGPIDITSVSSATVFLVPVDPGRSQGHSVGIDRIVWDPVRFHIVAKMNKALNEVRARESRRMASDGLTPVLKKSRWLLLKREENLKIEQRFRLRDLLRYNLKTVRAYLLKEAFQQLWDYNSPAWAGKFLDEWCRQVMRSRIEPMKKIARSLREHRELILNYFRAQKLLSSGVVEGLNNKAKVTMRRSYGFRTFRCLELALYHSLGKLPEPESTHEFF